MNTFTKFAAISLVMAFLAGCATSNEIAEIQRSDADVSKLMQANDNLIVPGERVGRVFLGMTEAQLYQRMGKPDSSSDEGTVVLYDWASLQVIVKASTHLVDVIDVNGPAYSTAAGLMVGMSELEMKGKQGQPAWGVLAYSQGTEYKYCYNTGMTIHVDKGQVTWFEVFPAVACQ